MKIGIFADPHYANIVRLANRFPLRSLGLMRDAMERFVREGVDAAVCMGDLINDSDDNLNSIEKAGRVMRESGLRCFLVQGNHDREVFSHEELSERSGLTIAPYVFDKDGVRIIMLDGNYSSDGKMYVPKKVDWTDCFIPDAELEFLKTSLATAEKSAYVFVHQCLAPDSEPHHLISNAAEVREILENAEKLKGVFCGHYHPGSEARHNGVYYRAFPAMCEKGEAEILDLE